MTADPMSETAEIEMKFIVASEALLAKARDVFTAIHDEMMGTRAYTSYLHYYDTAELDLRQNGVLLRARDAAPPHFSHGLTVKTGTGSDNGVVSRMEYEIPTPANGFHLQGFAGHPAEKILAVAQGRPLLHWFTTVTRREEIRGAFTIDDKRVVIECAFDHIAFLRGDNGETLHSNWEIELEFKPKGSDPTLTQAEAQAALRFVADILCESLPQLVSTTQSRADVGFGLLSSPKCAAPSSGYKGPQ